MADDGYDSMDAEAEREWHRKQAEGQLREELRREPSAEEPPCSSLFDPEEEPEEPHRHEIEWLMSADSPHPVAGYCSCGDKFTVSYAG